LRHDMKGFTLIEAMVSMVILSVGLLALGTLYVNVMDKQQIAQERLMAVHLAEQVMEYWQHDATDYVPNIDSTCRLTPGSSSTPGTISPCTTPTPFQVTYTISASISQAQAPLPTNPNNGGSPLVSPNPPPNPGDFLIRNMQKVTGPAGTSGVPMLKVVKVSWTHKGKTQTPVVLTHISRLQYQ